MRRIENFKILTIGNKFARLRGQEPVPTMRNRRVEETIMVRATLSAGGHARDTGEDRLDAVAEC